MSCHAFWAGREAAVSPEIAGAAGREAHALPGKETCPPALLLKERVRTCAHRLVASPA